MIYNCPECFNGYYNICANLRHGGGGFAEFMVARTPNVYTLPDSVSPEGGALAEVYAVAVHAVNRAMVSPGDRVAIVGSGPVGLTIAQVADVAGATSIAMLGKPDAPVQIAHEAVGALPINVDKTDAVEAIMDWSDGRGADVVFEIVKFRINKTPCAGSVRKPNLPGDASVSLFFGFTIK